MGTTITKETRFLGGNRYCGLNDDFYDRGRYGRKTGKTQTVDRAALLRPPMEIFFLFKASYNKTDASVFNLTDI